MPSCSAPGLSSSCSAATASSLLFLSQSAKDTELALHFARCVSEVSLSITGSGDSGTFQLPQKRDLVNRLVVSDRQEEWGRAGYLPAEDPLTRC